ncbi:MAG: hypothetical protein HPY69_08715 [Armatimonadetes bacterium]|nr:hypothetical protein [Armatimonadota bacterium]
MRRLTLSLTALWAVSVALAGPLADVDWTQLTIPRLVALPDLDGRISDGEWERAAPVGGFTMLGDETLSATQPEAWLGWHERGLLLAARIPLPPGQKARAQATDFDGTVWADDSVELHVDRGHRHERHYQFVVNALGTEFDSLAGDKAYNASWHAAATNEPGQWACELLIPWEAMGGGAPQPADRDGLNVAINASSLGGILTLSPISANLHDAARFAHVTYTDGPAAGWCGLDLDGNTATAAVLNAKDAKVELTVDGRPRTVTQQPDSGSAVSQYYVTSLDLPQEQGFTRAGRYQLELRARADGQTLLVQRVALAVGPPVELQVSAYLHRQELATTVALQPGTFPWPDSTVGLQVVADGQAVVERTIEPPADGGPARVTLPADELLAGTFQVRVTARNNQSGKAFTAERTLADPLRPEWLGTKEGLTDAVPAPWTPLQVQGDSVKPWGRSYRFAGSPLPTEVITRDASVLAGPVQLTGRVNGRLLAWRGSPVRFTSRRPAAVVLTGTQTSDALELAGTTTIEYDGMIRCDLELSPTSGAATVQELTLEIPLKAQHARYLYHFPGAWGSVANSAFLPPEGWTHGFKPFIWLGDEDRGFSWFCESDQNWFPLDTKDMLRIERRGEVVVLKCRLIRDEQRLGEPLRYTFGFEATPCKQPEKTVWDYRITHHGNYGIETQPASLGGVITYEASRVLRREEGTFECWYRPGFANLERGLPMAQRSATANRSIFTVKWGTSMGSGSNCGLYWNELVQGPVAWSRRNGQVLMNPGAPFDWEPGQWYHLALTWSDTVRIYVNGRLVAEAPNTGFIPQDLADAVVEIGGAMPLATIDEVRILSRARPPQPTPGEYEPDAETLLLDHFEGYGEPNAQTPGKPGPGVSFGPGKFGRAVTWEVGLARTQLQWLADLGVRTICFHEHWSPYQSHPYITDENRPKMRSLVDACKQQGVSLLLYMSRQFADNCPEWELRSDEFLQTPRGGAYRRFPKQSAYIACWNSPYKDFCLHHLGKLIDEFGHGGWYLDGPEWPMACDNESHGCGYVAPDGKRRPTWDIFATRDFMKRLYVLTRQRNPEGQLNIHNSTVMVIPTLGFGTSTWGGEQIDVIKPPARTLDFLPMDSFRTEFMGRQWGVPSEFLVYDGQPYYARDVLAYTLLHGVLIRPSNEEMLAQVSALWKAYDEFPFEQGRMYPYWDNGDYLRVSPEGVYATAWQLPAKGLLVVVSNLGDGDAEVDLKLDLERFGLRRVTVKDALTAEAIAFDDGGVSFPLASWRYRLLRVVPAP